MFPLWIVCSSWKSTQTLRLGKLLLLFLSRTIASIFTHGEGEQMNSLNQSDLFSLPDILLFQKCLLGASLVAQWLRICLPLQGTRFEPWSGKIPHAAEQLGPWATITEPARLEPVLRNKRGRDSERPTHRDEEWPPLATTRESPRTETKTQHSQK